MQSGLVSGTLIQFQAVQQKRTTSKPSTTFGGQNVVRCFGSKLPCICNKIQKTESFTNNATIQKCPIGQKAASHHQERKGRQQEQEKKLKAISTIVESMKSSNPIVRLSYKLQKEKHNLQSLVSMQQAAQNFVLVHQTCW